MTHYRNNARFAGVMFLLAMTASLVGGMMIQGDISQPDFMSNILDGKYTIITGVALELLNAFAVIGIAAALWNPLKQRSPAITAGYLCVRVVEATFCTAAAFIPVMMITLAEQTIGNRFTTYSERAFFANMLNTVRDDIVAYAVPIFFGIGAILLYIMLYRSGLIPKYIAIWGLAAAPAVIIANTFVTATMVKPVLVLPMIVNEIYLGIYLVAKGFRTAEA